MSIKGRVFFFFVFLAFLESSQSDLVRSLPTILVVAGIPLNLLGQCSERDEREAASLFSPPLSSQFGSLSLPESHPSSHYTGLSRTGTHTALMSLIFFSLILGLTR